MLNSGKKQKNKYPNSRVVRKKNSRRKKNHSPHPLQVKWSVPKRVRLVIYLFFQSFEYECT
jgi:hypothetical protein